MKRPFIRRLLASLMALALAAGLVPGALALENEGGGSGGVSWRQVDNDAIYDAKPKKRLADGGFLV